MQGVIWILILPFYSNCYHIPSPVYTFFFFCYNFEGNQYFLLQSSEKSCGLIGDKKHNRMSWLGSAPRGGQRGKKKIMSQLLQFWWLFKTELMMLCGFWERSRFGGFWVTCVVTSPKMHFHNFHGWHFLWFDTVSECTANNDMYATPGILYLIWLNVTLLFWFFLLFFKGLLDFFKNGVSGARESNAWKHGAFYFLTASRDKVEIWPLHRLKSKTDPAWGGGVGGVKKVKERGKGGVEVARKRNIVNPLSVWRCLFLSLFLSVFPPLPSLSNLIYSKHMCVALSLSASIRASGGPYDIV